MFRMKSRFNMEMYSQKQQFHKNVFLKRRDIPATRWQLLLLDYYVFPACRILFFSTDSGSSDSAWHDMKAGAHGGRKWVWHTTWLHLRSQNRIHFLQTSVIQPLHFSHKSRMLGNDKADVSSYKKNSHRMLKMQRVSFIGQQMSN